MKTKGQMAVAVGAGYMLGRTHRMKMALMLAAAGATGKFPGGPRDLLQRGTKMLASSPEFAKIGDTVRGELVNAAKAAAVTAASQRINSLNNRLQSGGEEVAGEVGDTVGGVGNSVSKLSRLGRKRPGRSTDDDNEDEDPEGQSADEEDASEEPDDDEADEEPAPRKRPTPRRRVSSTGSTRPTSRSRTAKSDKDNDNDNDNEETPVRTRRTRAKATTDSAPVRRARR
ncbi:hypothetical protein ACFVKB_47930 [Rhodococcus sp. NPDC127530]|uniref:hypothetical protein n=1 Tax=unclassified Rhodococcus (in: high G+C Gram-positive bacteria) TaxID=192944 RepID=UPI0036268C57